MGKWSDFSLVKVVTFRELHMSSHCWLQITLSSLLSVCLDPPLPLDQVNCTPLVGRWNKLLLSDQSEKSFMGPLAGGNAPLCSWEPRIELKSPIEHQGMVWF